MKGSHGSHINSTLYRVGGVTAYETTILYELILDIYEYLNSIPSQRRSPAIAVGAREVPRAFRAKPTLFLPIR